MLMRMHLNKILTEVNINKNPKNRIPQFFRGIKKKNNYLMRTTRPVSKEIKMKSKQKQNMENPEMFQRNYLSIQKQKVIHKTCRKPII